MIKFEIIGINLNYIFYLEKYYDILTNNQIGSNLQQEFLNFYGEEFL